MNIVTLGGEAEAGLVEEIERRAGTDVKRCLQCGKCSAGCPMSFMYDLSVNQVLRLVRESRRKEALSCRSIWLCASCHTCSSRCPAGIDPAGVMESLRHMARQEGLAADPDPKTFANAFLASLKHFGRTYEIEIMLRYNLLSGHPFASMDLAPGFLAKGKLHFLPPSTGGRAEVTRIVERFEKEQAK
jgi:heterodisulfide reductase subunit C